MIGQLLDGRYQVINFLGQGGQGHTYIALDTRRPGQPKCVVKHLKPLFSNSPELLETARRLFEAEAVTLEKLGKYDQIPQLLAHFEQNKEFYLVEEFVEGYDLTQEISSGTLENPGKQQHENYVKSLLHSILPVLEFLHQKGVIHRDIKPSNIVRQNSDNNLILIDFGAVKQVQTQTALTTGMSASISIGSEGYISSEQLQGKPKPSSDLYALGMVGIQALTGVAPRYLQEDPDTEEVSWQHLTSVSTELAELLGKMVRSSSKERYKSAREVLEVLHLIKSGCSPTAAVGGSEDRQTGSDDDREQEKEEKKKSKNRNTGHSTIAPVTPSFLKLWWVGAGVVALIVSTLLVYVIDQQLHQSKSPDPDITPTEPPTPDLPVSPPGEVSDRICPDPDAPNDPDCI